MIVDFKETFLTPNNYKLISVKFIDIYLAHREHVGRGRGLCNTLGGVRLKYNQVCNSSNFT